MRFNFIDRSRCPLHYGVMVNSQSAQMNKRLFAWYIIPICLCFIFMGGTVFKIAPPYSPQPHHPRAVLETANKLVENATTNGIIAIELCNDVPDFPHHNAFTSRLSRLVPLFDSTATSTNSERAPPALASRPQFFRLYITAQRVCY